MNADSVTIKNKTEMSLQRTGQKNNDSSKPDS